MGYQEKLRAATDEVKQELKAQIALERAAFEARIREINQRLATLEASLKDALTQIQGKRASSTARTVNG